MSQKISLYSFACIFILTVAGYFAAQANNHQNTQSVIYYYISGRYLTAFRASWFVFTTSSLSGHLASVNTYQLYSYTLTAGYITLYFNF
jgi:hypothetical protein